MVTICIGCFDGVEFKLPAARISSHVANELRAGVPFGQESSDLFIDSSRHYIYFWKLFANGIITVNDGNSTIEDSLSHLCSLTWDQGLTGGYIILEPQPGALYEDFVSAADTVFTEPFNLWSHNEHMPYTRCAIIVPVSSIE